MIALKNRSTGMLIVPMFYFLFVIGYWRLPFILFSTENDMDNFRHFYMGMFSAVIIVACLLKKKWIASIILVLISLPLVLPEMLMPLGLNFRESAYIFANFMIVAFGFTMLFIVFAEIQKRPTVTRGKAIIAFSIILALQIINPLTLFLFSGPK